MPDDFTISFSSSTPFLARKTAAAARLLFQETTQAVYFKNTFYQVPSSGDRVRFTHTLLRKEDEQRVCFFVVGDKVFGEGGFGKVVSVPYYFYLQETLKLQLQPSNYVVKVQDQGAYQEALSLHKRCKIYLSMDDGEHNYMVMDYLGKSLKDCHKVTRTFEERAEISLALANELQRIHQTGKIHRDLKPHNILYDEKNKIVSVIDDGLAISLEKLRSRRSRGAAGTPGYISPESFSPSAVITFASDIYSLAGIFADVWGAQSSLQYKNLHYKIDDRDSLEKMAKEQFKLSGYLTTFPQSESPYLHAFDLPQALICLINGMQDQMP